ncbi:MAG: molybdopterin molybdotransferase MoeA [Sphingomicrobium sp.]
MISFDEALSQVLAAATGLGEEVVPLARAVGRWLAQPARAAIDSPRRAVSTMDGYAVREADIENRPARLPVVSEIYPGTAHPGSLIAGNCARIFTGAPLPDGADRVVMQEEARREGGMAIFDRAVSSARFVRARASDFAAGSIQLPVGRQIRPLDLVAAAGSDLSSLTCWRRPRIWLLANGDELVAPGEAATSPGSIPDSVTVGLSAMIENWGGDVVGMTRLPDDLAVMQRAAAQAAASADLLVVIGGASVGDRDFAKAMMAPLGLDLAFSRVAMKPGKPVWFGRCGATLVMGLPGNPTSALVTARLLLAPLIIRLAGGDPAEVTIRQTATLANSLDPCADRETFSRGRWEDGRVLVLGNQDSGAQSTLADAELLIRQRANSPAVCAGESIEFFPF